MKKYISVILALIAGIILMTVVAMQPLNSQTKKHYKITLYNCGESIKEWKSKNVSVSSSETYFNDEATGKFHKINGTIVIEEIE